MSVGCDVLLFEKMCQAGLFGVVNGYPIVADLVRRLPFPAFVVFVPVVIATGSGWTGILKLVIDDFRRALYVLLQLLVEFEFELIEDQTDRIAELFDELRQQGIEAITIEHVKEIITRIGKPEELTGEDGEKQQEGNGTNWEEQARSAGQKIYENVRARTAGKKLYRNPKDKMLAGVLSGIAVYTNTDPVIWRFLMILFTFCYGVGIFIYLVLALVIPEARTPEQLLQMEGKDITPQNLADVVVEGEKQHVQRPGFMRLLFIILMKMVIAFVVIISSSL